jgi:hypothetical protein
MDDCSVSVGRGQSALERPPGPVLRSGSGIAAGPEAGSRPVQQLDCGWSSSWIAAWFRARARESPARLRAPRRAVGCGHPLPWQARPTVICWPQRSSSRWPRALRTRASASSSAAISGRRPARWSRTPSTRATGASAASASAPALRDPAHATEPGRSGGARAQENAADDGRREGPRRSQRPARPACPGHPARPVVRHVPPSARGEGSLKRAAVDGHGLAAASFARRAIRYSPFPPGWS